MIQLQSVEKLLTVKISPPQIGAETITRQRLLKSFDGYSYKKLTTVSAPTGYGKTVLISQFAKQVNQPVVWYQLDEFDNDLTIFIRYFIAGIARKIPHFGWQTLDFIEQQKDVCKHVRSIVVLIANELEARVQEGLVFILDDYHLIKETMIYKFMEELIEYLPQGVHIVISSRYVLPLKYSRLKAHGLVNEVTYESLKFSRNEIRVFLDFHKGSGISKDIIEKAEIETDGWAVALSLIKASLVRREEVKRDLDLMQWKSREEVYNYLAEEVFNQLSEELQTFLIHTSILDVITPNICDELLERNDTKEILANLMKRNIFLLKIEEGENTYRYHHLFRDFLQERLGKKKQIFLEKAGQYYLTKGEFQQAIEYYLTAGLYEKAGLAIEKIGIEMLKSGKWQTVNRWIEKIPKENIKKSACFMLLKGVVYSNKGMWNEALIQLDGAIEIFLSSGNQEGVLSARFQKSIVLRRRGLSDKSLKLLNEILASVYSLPILKWYDIMLEKVNILLWTGSLNEAVETLKQGIESAQHDEEHGLVAYFMEHLGATYYATGDYYKAVEFYEAAKERYLQVYNPLSMIEKERYSQRTTLARIYRDWGELEKALELIQEEINIKEELGLMDDLPRAYHQLALICNDLGEKEEAERHFQHADELYNKLDRRDFQWTWHRALYGRILIKNGKSQKGKLLIQKAIERAKENSDFNLAVCEFIGACGYISCGQINEALELLEHALEEGKNIGAKNLICQCYWILSNIYLNMGNEEKAKEYALHCFTLARDGNYMQVFLSYEATSFPIIKRAIEMGIEEGFIEKIVLRLGRRAQEMLQELVKYPHLDIKQRAKQLLLQVEGKEIIPQERILLNPPQEKTQENELAIVYCFGNFEVLGKDDYQPVQWKTSKAKELFAYLIKNSNKTINKEKILEDIWPDMDPEQTSKWLHTYIYQIRKVLKNFGIRKGLIYEHKGYRLESQRVVCDVDKFEYIINNYQLEEKENQLKYLIKAINLYRGEYLEGCYSKWIIEEKHRLEGLYLLALERLAERYIEDKEYHQAVDCLNKMLKTAPLLEKAHEMLMIIYEKMGDRIAAITQYENFHQTIKSELGIEPRTQMKALYNKLMEANKE